MIPVPDIVIRETDSLNKWCASGHFARGTFKRNGPDSEPNPIRFFRVTVNNIDDIFCEPCIIVARYLAKRKKGKENG